MSTLDAGVARAQPLVVVAERRDRCRAGAIAAQLLDAGGQAVHHSACAVALCAAPSTFRITAR